MEYFDQTNSSEAFGPETKGCDWIRGKESHPGCTQARSIRLYFSDSKISAK
jgi:hypothetical protein